MDFYASAGPMALGSRLRALSARVSEEAAQVYAQYAVDIDPRWFPVFYVLAQGERRTVTEIARIIGQSHASVSQVVKAMTEAGLIDSAASEHDGRARQLALSPVAQDKADRLQDQFRDVTTAVEAMLADTEHNLWLALGEIEAALEERDLVRRVSEARRARMLPNLKIRDFIDADASAFARLNYEWIERYFEVEEQDRQTLHDPWSAMLKPGGTIIMAVSKEDALGTVALTPMLEDGVYELAKLAVAPPARGLGVGQRLAEAAISWAKKRKAERIFAEASSRLKPAMGLFRKLGFEVLDQAATPNDRGDVQMELLLG